MGVGSGWKLGVGSWELNQFTVGVIQDHAGTDLQENVRRAERLVRQAAGKGAQIICLKELFSSPYLCKGQKSDRFDLAEPIPGPSTDAMQKLASELAVVIVVPATRTGSSTRT